MSAARLLELDQTMLPARRTPVDVDAATIAARDLLVALGADLDAPGLAETPRRIATTYSDLLTPRPFSMTTFPNDERYDGLVLARDIPFTSLCEHHALPFVGVAHVGYVPDRRLAGLSKLARAVEHFARRLQVQERMTVQIADLLEDELSPRGVGVVLEAEHLCMTIRGVKAFGARTTTSALSGVVRDDGNLRRELLALTTTAH